MQKLILYGSGRRCERICKLLKQANIEITAVLDSSREKWGKTVEGCLIEKPEKICNLSGACLCITVADIDAKNTIRKELKEKYHYNFEREINYNELILEAYEKNVWIRKQILNEKIDYDREEAVLFSLKNGFVLGGIEEWTTGLCKAMIENGRKEVYVISREGDYHVPKLLTDHMLLADMNLSAQFTMDAVLNICKVILRKLPCTVITTQPDEIMMAAYLVKCCYPGQIEIISTIRGGQEQIYDAYMDFKRCPDLYIGVSQDIRRNMIQRGIAPERILTMCVPFACEKLLKRTYTLQDELPIKIGYAGRLEKIQKRMDLLLKLLVELDDKKVDFNAEVAGDGPMREEMEKFVCLNHLESKVKFLGRIQRSEIPAFWKKQDICVNIADYEGRSHSIIEAMGNGAVPVVTATSGVKDDIVDGVNGYIVPLGGYGAMAEKIAYLAENRKRLCEMGKAAHDEVYPKSRMEDHLRFWETVFSRRK